MDDIGHKDYRIRGAETIFSTDTRIHRDMEREHSGHHRQRKKEEQSGNEVKDNINDIITMVEGANIQLELKRSPIRFNIHRDGEDVFIDVIITDDEGNIVTVREKNITHEQILAAIERIHEREGLLIDTLG